MKNQTEVVTAQHRTCTGRPATLLGLPLLAALLCGLAANTAHAESPRGEGPPEFAKGRILVEPIAGVSPAELAKVLSAYGGRGRKIGQGNLHVVDLSATGGEQAAVAKLARHPLVKFAELDRRVKSTFVSNDPYAGSEWHLAKVGAPAAWDKSQGAGVVIAILDSGVDGTHPDLVPNLVPGYNLVDNNTNTADVCGHGTAVAGTAAAAGNNGIGVTGIAGQARIMPLRIASFDATANGCTAYLSTIVSGITYAADHGARIVNASYGGLGSSASVQSAAQYLKGKGGLLFISAGNNGINENIAPSTAMIPVSATDSNDAITSWSSYGSFVALSAPGLGIYTTSQGGGYGAWNGTSFASPLTAGVGALLMAANPALDNLTIEKLMYTTATDLGTAGRDIYYGYGRVNAAAGVQAAVGTVVTLDTQAPTATISSPAASSTASGTVVVSVAALDNVGVARVELQVNGSTVAIDNAAPFSFGWDSSSVPNGMNTLVAVAYDAAGNFQASAPVSLNVSNTVVPVVADTTPPVVTISNPVAGRISGTVNVTVSATDNSGAAKISQQLYIDGALKAKATGGALAYSWNTRKLKSGTHTIQAVAKDAAGNTATVSVQVAN